MDTRFYILVCVFYGFAALSLAIYLKNFSYVFLRLNRWLLATAVSLHAGLILAMFFGQQSIFPSNSFQTQLIIGLVLAVMAWFLSFQRSALFLSKILILLSLSLVIFASLLTPTKEAPLIRDPWLWTHIVLTVLGEVFFFVGAAVSIVYLAVNRQLRLRKISSSLFARLPSLSDFDRLLGETLLAGFILLTLGMVLGFMFAERYWGATWIFDPKVLLCLLTWLVYALLLILRQVSSAYRGRTSATLAVVGFLAVILLSSGMDILFQSRHNLSLPSVIESPRTP